MSLTTVLKSSTNQSAYGQLTQQQLLHQTVKAFFFDRFVGGEGSDNPLIVKQELMAQKGGTVCINMMAALTGAGVTGETTLSGAEEAATISQLYVDVDAVANAVKFHKLSEQKSIHNLREAGKVAGGRWMGAKIDDKVFAALNAQEINLICGGDATGTSDLAAGDKMTLDVISRAKVKAQDELIQPLNINGETWYILVMSNWQTWDLKQTTDWKQVNREARERATTNPIFSGAAGVYDGVILYTNDRTGKGTDAGAESNVAYARAHLMGSNAVGIAWAQMPSLIEEVVDYKRQYGVGVESILGVKAAVWGSTAAGHVPVLTAAANPNA